eukprot:gb/GECH01009382.1/.p1 GENE.gb/GECH01009382.1/~~gb/GECH01009382.1/.p1  ORF type:complete len:220 (+),score=33.35 gb/GECH01009382.1/:1-660(+)
MLIICDSFIFYYCFQFPNYITSTTLNNDNQLILNQNCEPFTTKENVDLINFSPLLCAQPQRSQVTMHPNFNISMEFLFSITNTEYCFHLLNEETSKNTPLENKLYSYCNITSQDKEKVEVNFPLITEKSTFVMIKFNDISKPWSVWTKYFSLPFIENKPRIEIIADDVKQDKKLNLTLQTKNASKINVCVKGKQTHECRKLISEEHSKDLSISFDNVTQ